MKGSKEEVLVLEKKIKDLTEINSKFLKEKKGLQLTNEYLNVIKN